MNLVLLVLNYSVVFVSEWCNPFCGSDRLVNDHGGPYCAACLVYKVFCCVCVALSLYLPFTGGWEVAFLRHSTSS